MLTLMPKFELHAHLNGSLCVNSIRELQSTLEEAGVAAYDDHEEIVAYSVDTQQKQKLEEVFQLFSHVHRLTATALGLKLATELVIRDFAKDNVIYLELRTTAKDNEHMTKREYLICVLEAIKNADEVKNNKIMVKLLPSINRANGVKEAEEILDVVLDLCQSEYKNLIAGLDFSGNPTKGVFQDFLPVLKNAKENGFPLAIHCAEIYNPEEADLMIDFGMQRCGHGTFLTEAQRARLAEQNIATECCLSSNVLGGTVKAFENHHFKKIFSQYYPVVVCTDDCGIFNTKLTKEFQLTAYTFQLVTNEMKELCENGLKYAFLSDDERIPLQKKIDEFFDPRKRFYI